MQCTKAWCVTGGLHTLQSALIRKRELRASTQPVICDLLDLQHVPEAVVVEVASFFKQANTIFYYGDLLLPISVKPNSGKLTVTSALTCCIACFVQHKFWWRNN